VQINTLLLIDAHVGEWPLQSAHFSFPSDATNSYRLDTISSSVIGGSTLESLKAAICWREIRLEKITTPTHF
jgi:hypothetical protein